MSAADSPAAAAVRADIKQSGGWIPFSRYLEIVLHEPHCGFYGSGRVQFGLRGDFITAPVLSPLFGQMLAQQAAEVIQNSAPCILELGGGDGALANAIISALHNPSAPTSISYTILETSHALRTRQQTALQKWDATPSINITWTDTLPKSFCGIIIANEVLDSLPFALCAHRNGKWFERGVEVDKGGALCWREQAASDDLLPRLQSLAVPDNYETEINLRAEALVRTLCQNLQHGAALFVDYGFGRAEYYHPQRTNGTLMCHRRGQMDDAPLESPGDKDITAHVDFSAIAEAALEGGAQLAGYVSQAQFLLNCGIADVLSQAAQELTTVQYAKLAAGAQKLLNPQDMGELFKCIAFVKNMPQTLLGFSDGDRTRHL